MVKQLYLLLYLKHPVDTIPIKILSSLNLEETQFLNNLLNNNYIDKKNHEQFINDKIILKKIKKIFIEDTRYYVEDIRKDIVDQFGFDRVYKQGFNIKTPLNLNLQSIATKVLRKGLETYDKRKGWRGSLTNKEISKNWHKDKDLKRFKLEKSINWELAIVKKIDQFSIDIETEKKITGKINYNQYILDKKGI